MHSPHPPLSGELQILQNSAWGLQSATSVFAHQQWQSYIASGIFESMKPILDGLAEKLRKKQVSSSHAHLSFLNLGMSADLDMATHAQHHFKALGCGPCSGKGWDSVAACTQLSDVYLNVPIATSWRCLFSVKSIVLLMHFLTCNVY